MPRLSVLYRNLTTVKSWTDLRIYIRVCFMFVCFPFLLEMLQLLRPYLPAIRSFSLVCKYLPMDISTLQGG